MGEVVIERASPYDVGAIHRIEQESFPAPWRAEFFAGEIAADGRFNLVAKKDGEVIAYLFAMWIFDEMHVNKIAVDARMRRQGIAELLMEHAFTFAKSKAITTISLEVRQSNEGAQEFYRHLDFIPAFVRKRYYPDGEHAVVMTREL